MDGWMDLVWTWVGDGDGDGIGWDGIQGQWESRCETGRVYKVLTWPGLAPTGRDRIYSMLCRYLPR